MAGKGIIIMSTRELKRLPIIHKIINKELRQCDASEILGLCTRQLRRIVERVRKEGDQGIVHKSRGRPSNRTKPSKLKDKVLALCRTRYQGFNPTFAAEKLFEIDEIIVHPETLRLWFIQAGVQYEKRRGRKHRSWRERKQHFGEMIQMDGSHHAWFEARGPQCVLIGYVGDATGNKFARFYQYEGTFPALDSLKRYIKKYGIPYSIYIDRHAAYKSKAKPSIEEQLNNKNPLTQVGRALEELGVRVIFADSPQAKGRIERCFRTFQDRLIKEMRLRHIKTIDQANSFLQHYLPTFNKRFNVAPLEKADLHRRLPQDIDLNRILCVKEESPLRNDFTVVYNKKLYQITDHTNAKKLAVEQRTDGKIFISYNGRNLKYKQIAKRPEKKKPELRPRLKARKTYKPPLEHPFKGPMFRRRYPHIHSYPQKEKVGQKEKELLLVH